MSRLTFSPFTLDLDRRLLLREDAEVHITPKAFQLLHTLARNAPRALSKQELFDTVWPDTIVAEVNLASTIAELRSAMDDDARNPRFIRTVHAYGYAFVAPLQEAELRRTARFHVFIGGIDFALTPGEHILGRDQEATLIVADSSVSRQHARLIVGQDSALIEDLDSKNGTFLNGQKISEPVALKTGDVIGLGDVSVIFRDLGSSESTRTL